MKNDQPQTTIEPTEKDRQWAAIFLGMLNLPEKQEQVGVTILSKMFAWSREEGRLEGIRIREVPRNPFVFCDGGHAP